MEGQPLGTQVEAGNIRHKPKAMVRLSIRNQGRNQGVGHLFVEAPSMSHRKKKTGKKKNITAFESYIFNMDPNLGSVTY